MEQKPKVMISQPMRGLTEEQIHENRKKIVEQLEQKGFEVINTVHPKYPSELAEKKMAIPLWHLGKSIEFMATVDLMFFMKGWNTARGCKIEHRIANDYGMQIMYEEGGEKNGLEE